MPMGAETLLTFCSSCPSATAPLAKPQPRGSKQPPCTGCVQFPLCETSHTFCTCCAQPCGSAFGWLEQEQEEQRRGWHSEPVEQRPGPAPVRSLD